MNKIKEFWCKHYYPFCNIKNVKHKYDVKFNVLKEDEIKNNNLTSEEKRKNEELRKQNNLELEKKGGIEKYLINWLATTLLYLIVVDFIIKPETILEKIPFGIIGFLLCGGTLFLSLFYIEKIRNKNK